MFVIVRLVDNIWLLINLSQIKQHSIELHNVSGFKWLNNVVMYFLAACTYKYRAKFCIGTRALTSTCTYEHKKPSKVKRLMDLIRDKGQSQADITIHIVVPSESTIICWHFAIQYNRIKEIPPLCICFAFNFSHVMTFLYYMGVDF